MKKILLFAAATAVALSSCSKDEVTTTSADNNAIGFGVYTGVSTKGAVTAIPDASTEFSMYVLGYYTDDTKWIPATTTGDGASTATATATANFMYNQKVSTTDKGSNWTYSPIKYWPNENTDYISFFAYAPAIDSEAPYATLTAASVEGTPTLEFDYSDDSFDMSKTTDFVADSAIDQTQANNGTGVSFTLIHELTRVALSVELSSAVADDAATTVVVKSIKFSGKNIYDKGTYTFADVSTETVGTWDNTGSTSYGVNGTTFEMISYMSGYTASTSLGEKEDYTKGGVSLTTTNASTLGEGEYVFALPAYAASAATGTAGDVVLTIVYDVVTKDAAVANTSYSAIENTKEFDLTSSDGVALVQGKAYSYKFKIGLTAVTLSATVTDSWNGESSEEKVVDADADTESL